MARPITTYQVWQHPAIGDRWVVRLEYDVLTGVYGPIPPGAPLPAEFEGLYFEDHPDDLDWIVRAAEKFTILPS